MPTILVAVVLLCGCALPGLLDDNSDETKSSQNAVSNANGIVGAWIYSYPQHGCKLVFYFGEAQDYFYQRLCGVDGQYKTYAVQTAFGAYSTSSGQLELFTTRSTCPNAHPYSSLDWAISKHGGNLSLWVDGVVLVMARLDLNQDNPSAEMTAADSTIVLGCYERDGDYFNPHPIQEL